MLHSWLALTIELKPFWSHIWIYFYLKGNSALVTQDSIIAFQIFHILIFLIFLGSTSDTLRSQIEGHTRLLIFKKFSPLPDVIWASPFINFQENFQSPCFFTYTNEKFSTLPAVIRASPLIKFEEKFQPPLLLEPPLVLET